MEEKQFEIIHLSFRKKRSGNSYGGPVNYYIGNIVFRMLDGEGKEHLKWRLEEYQAARVCTDLNLLKRYEEGLEFEFGDIDEESGLGALDIVNKEGIKREDVYVKGYRRTESPLYDYVTYIEKFDCYRMSEYYQDNPVVRGVIQYLQDMKEGKPNPSRTTYWHQFLCTLENLCWWWD
jgi:hypothetical protein